MTLQSKLLETIRTGLERRSLEKCSTWAEKCRVMGQPFPGLWRFKYHPWAREMHDTDHEFCIGQKGAQLAYTETVLNRTFYKIDIKQESVLYILPAKSPDASDFSSSRFDPALELSDYLQNLFSDVKNVGHKRSGGSSLYIRGSRSRSGLKSVPAGFLVFDEVDEMTQDNIPLAFERQSGQMEKQTWMISTPTLPDYGINVYYSKSDQREFFFKCPYCHRQTYLIFPECLEIIGEDPSDKRLRETYIKCKECNHELPHAEKHEFLKDGVWIPAAEGSDYRGYHINQLYSSTTEPWRLAESFLYSDKSVAHEQEFYNSKLGLPHIVADAKIEDSQINACIGEHKNGVSPGNTALVTMGIDVGRWIHIIVNEYTVGNHVADVNMASSAKTIYIHKVLSFEEIDPIVYKYRPQAIVIDGNPERRKAFEFAQRFWGHVWLCFYGNAINGKQISKTKDANGVELEQQVTVDRTSWLDLSLGRIRNATVRLPLNIPLEYRTNIKAIVRKPEIDKYGNPISRYINTGPDHYGHANNYAEIALPLAIGLGQAQNIRSPL